MRAGRLDLRAAAPDGYRELAARAGAGLRHDDPAELTVGVATDGTAAHVRAILDALDPTRTLVRDFAVHGATLDDVFLALTKETTHA